MMQADSYVYVIFRTSGVPCYIGKGRGDRWKRHATRAQNPHLAAIFARSGGHLPTVKIRDGLTDEQAKKAEIAFIAAIGREAHGGPLVNLTDGGDGSAGAVMSPEWRQKRSERARKWWQNPAHRATQQARMQGNTYTCKARSVEWRAKIGASLLGNKHTAGKTLSDAQKAAISAAHLGKPKSECHRKKISDALMGKQLTKERCAVISAALSGRSLSAEQKAKIGAAQRGRAKPDSMKQKISANMQERWKNPEYAARIAAGNKGKVINQATRDAVAAANRNRVISDETRAKMRAAQLRRHSQAKGCE